MNYIYIRVSTERQDYERQINNFNLKGFKLYLDDSEDNAVPTILSERDDVTVVAEKYTGTKIKGRKQLQYILNHIQEDDVLIIDSLSRLARSMKDLLDIIEQVSKRKAGFISLKEDLDLTTATGKLMFNLIGAINQFERDITSERTKEALQAKKVNGVKLGRDFTYDPEQVLDLVFNKKMTYRAVQKELGISLSSISNIVNNHKDKMEESD